MAEHNEIGKKGEELAVDFLKKKGLNVLECNWRFGKHEVDIIAKTSDFIVFVEVKTRSTDFFGEPESFVTKQKQKNLIRAANAYLESKDIDLEVRFDIVSVLKTKSTFKVYHIESAFNAIN